MTNLQSKLERQLWRADVLCADVLITRSGTNESFRAILSEGYSTTEFEEWFDSLNTYHDQTDSGTVCFKDGTWLERYEHEGWTYVEHPLDVSLLTQSSKVNVLVIHLYNNQEYEDGKDITLPLSWLDDKQKELVLSQVKLFDDVFYDIMGHGLFSCFKDYETYLYRKKHGYGNEKSNREEFESVCKGRGINHEDIVAGKLPVFEGLCIELSEVIPTLIKAMIDSSGIWNSEATCKIEVMELSKGCKS